MGLNAGTERMAAVDRIALLIVLLIFMVSVAGADLIDLALNVGLPLSETPGFR
jgi:hypothetical protein